MKTVADNTNNYFNRELSWLEFNERVLEEMYDTTNPLFERLKFAAIVSSNLDEFFMVRVGSLWELVKAEFNAADPSGLSPLDQLKKIYLKTHDLVQNQYSSYNRSLKVSLKKEKIIFLKDNELNKTQIEYLNEYYLNKIYPVLTPMVVDQSRPFPLILNKSLNIALLLQDNDDSTQNIFATIQVPSVLNRIIELPSKATEKNYIFLEDVIKLHLKDFFSDNKIVAQSCYRITRNADLSLDEEDADDLLESIKQSLKQRKWGFAVRLEIEKNISNDLLDVLKEELEVSNEQCYFINGPLDLTFLMKFSNNDEFSKFKYSPIEAQFPLELLEDSDLFSLINKNDIFLHHPYQSFDPVVDLVKKSAEDPNVLAIKQTLYRVSGNSPIIEALAQAAENGKQVTVLVELKARFDEQNNIQWARRLEKAGCHVIYGLVGLKTHCKILLIVRMEEEGIKRYVHLGTGNYNDVTANIYTDIGLFTSNPYFGADASSLFNMLSGLTQPENLYKLTIAPIQLRSKFTSLIEREINNAKEGKKAKIIVKLNSLVDKAIIDKLYEASNAGVIIELIIRGICCLKPKVPSLSENITVRSIVGRFLEHSRIFYFYNDGDENIFLSSADWMTRNLDRRVELLFPVEDKKTKSKVMEVLTLSLKDTVKARTLNSDGSYSRIDKRGKESINSQESFYKLYLKSSLKHAKKTLKNETKKFTPINKTSQA